MCIFNKYDIIDLLFIYHFYKEDLSMKFYSEKLSPRRLSLQWRLTLLISGLVITACALMYFFISRSAVTGLEGISDYVVLVTPDNSNPISINCRSKNPHP